MVIRACHTPSRCVENWDTLEISYSCHNAEVEIPTSFIFFSVSICLGRHPAERVSMSCYNTCISVSTQLPCYNVIYSFGCKWIVPLLFWNFTKHSAQLFKYWCSVNSCCSILQFLPLLNHYSTYITYQHKIAPSVRICS